MRAPSRNVGMNAADDSILDAWRINNRVSTFLVEALPAGVWTSAASR